MGESILLSLCGQKQSIGSTRRVLFTKESQIIGLTEMSGQTDAGVVGVVVASQEVEVASPGAGVPCRCPQDPL